VRDRLSGPRFAHVGLTVEDLEAAVRWYGAVLGLELLAGPVEVEAGAGHAGRAAADVFGPAFRRLRQAHLGTIDGAAIELFEFVEPRSRHPADRFDYRRQGCFHFCLVAPDIESAVRRIERGGGRRRTAIWAVAPGSPCRFCFCEDPWGNVFELHTHSPERVYGAGPVVENTEIK
jgi:catechol 2,3-dioxygenase-like lactoylglutathione lyase family enzyme